MNYLIVLNILQKMDLIPTVKLNSKKLLLFVKLTKEISLKREEYLATFKKMMQDNGINEEKNETWNIPEEKKEEMNKKINELLSEKVMFKNANFLSEEEYFELWEGSGVKISDIEMFYEVLVKV